MKNSTISNIYYSIVVTEGERKGQFTFSFDRLFNNDREDGDDYEFVYALNEIAEDIMQMQLWQMLDFKADRNGDATGSICRLS